MKCPFRKITKHISEGQWRYARDEEYFADCYEKECPYYDNFLSDCSKVIKDRRGEEVKDETDISEDSGSV